MVVVPNSEQGAHVAAPAAKDIYDVIYGIHGTVLNDSSAAHRGGRPPAQLPCFAPKTGQISAPTPTCHATPDAQTVTDQPAVPAPGTGPSPASTSAAPSSPAASSAAAGQQADAEPASRFRPGVPP